MKSSPRGKGKTPRPLAQVSSATGSCHRGHPSCCPGRLGHAPSCPSLVFECPTGNIADFSEESRAPYSTGKK